MSLIPSLRRDNLALAFTICLLAYIVALAIAILTGYFLKDLMHPLLVTLLADVNATLIIYIFSVLFNNSSLYDPYWSIAPIPIALYWLFFLGSDTTITTKQIIVLIIVCLWAIRLTLNWARGWKGMNHEDWRYEELREKNPKIFWLTNLFGIQLMPTILVYLGCLSLYPILLSTKTVFTIFDIIGILITMMAIGIEFVSDEQLKKFKANKKSGEVINTGLWKYSRHPNYFGEISFWWGLYFFALGANINYWWVVVGPISMTLLFLTISIPMMEKRLLEKYPQYSSYREKVSRLIPWFLKE